MKLHALSLITAAALALPSLAVADTPSKTTTTAGDSNKLITEDARIVSHLHHVNQMEIDLGKQAQKSGTSTVKGYADALVVDHTAADKDLVALAKKHGLTTIPADKPMTDAERQDEKDMTIAVTHLKTLKGAEFDKEYLNMMVSGHDKELTKIDVAISGATDPDLKSMLQSVKPVLQRHADQARDLQKSPQASANMSNDKMPASKTDKTDKSPTSK